MIGECGHDEPRAPQGARVILCSRCLMAGAAHRAEEAQVEIQNQGVNTSIATPQKPAPANAGKPSGYKTGFVSLRARSRGGRPRVPEWQRRQARREASRRYRERQQEAHRASEGLSL